MNQLDVIKIGGENAGTDLETTVEYVSNNQNNSQSLVVSAMRKEGFNTTDKLKDTAQLLSSSDLEGAKAIFNDILLFHIEALEQQGGINIIPEIKNIFLNISESFENNLGRSLEKENDYMIDVFGKKESLLGLGEKISAIVHTRLLEEKGVDAQMLDMENIEIGENDNYKQKVIAYFSQEVTRILDEGKVPVVGGYIGNIPGGILNSIDRGYTDATASLLALSQYEKFEKTRLNIFKSVDGILGADPRIFRDSNGKNLLRKNEKIDLISHMDYLTARELTGGSIGGKAKFLHEYALSQEIMDAGIELKIMDPKKPGLGTTVNAHKNKFSRGVEIVNKRDGISFVRITKAAFAEGVGDVEKIFDIVRSKGFSIDMITTSETQVSFSLELNDSKSLDELQKTIEKEFFGTQTSNIDYVEVQKNMSLIHCIGQNLDNEYQISLAYGILALEKEGIKIHTFGGEREKGAIIFAVEEKDAIKSVQILARQFNLVKEVNEI